MGKYICPETACEHYGICAHSKEHEDLGCAEGSGQPSDHPCGFCVSVDSLTWKQKEKMGVPCE